MKAYIELFRVYQWPKNVFVLAPLFFDEKLLDKSDVVQSIGAFLCFCFLASAIYVLNDWRDVEADRLHPEKKNRPLASNRISLAPALCAMIILVLLGVGTVLIFKLNDMFILIAIIYVLFNLAYSFGLKHVPIIELLIVGSGFVLRVLAGGAAISVDLSPWIIVATATLALLITTGKRRADMMLGGDSVSVRKALDGYDLSFLDTLITTLTSMTLVVYLLFCVSEYAQDRFGQNVLLTAVPVAVGLLKYLQLIIVDMRGDNPTKALLGDKMIVSSVIIFAAIFSALLYYN